MLLFLHLKTEHKSVDISPLLCYTYSRGGGCMSFSYKPLWKQLIDKDMTKKRLMTETGISKSTMDKMGRSEQVSMDIIDRVCSYLDCNIENVVEHIKDGKQ